jgi:hypothetical protein
MQKVCTRIMASEMKTFCLLKIQATVPVKLAYLSLMLWSHSSILEFYSSSFSQVNSKESRIIFKCYDREPKLTLMTYLAALSYNAIWSFNLLEELSQHFFSISSLKLWINAWQAD